MKEYCLGFAFNNNGQMILIKKNRPDYQAGKLNGVGGKIEEGETAKIAMQREFAEETGVITFLSQWEQYATLQGDEFKVSVFKAFLTDEQFERAETNTDEKVVKGSQDDFWGHASMYGFASSPEDQQPLMANLKVLIEAAKVDDPEMGEIIINYKVSK